MSCHRNKQHEGEPTGLHGRNKYCSCSPGLRCAAKIELFRSTRQLQCQNVALSWWRKGAQLCHATETNTMKATQQDCMEGTNTAVVPLGRSMWKAQLPPCGYKFEYLHLFSFIYSTRRHTAFPDGERIAKHIRSSSSLTLCRYCLHRHLASRHHSPFQLQPPRLPCPAPSAPCR